MFLCFPAWTRTSRTATPGNRRLCLLETWQTPRSCAGATRTASTGISSSKRKLHASRNLISSTHAKTCWETWDLRSCRGALRAWQCWVTCLSSSFSPESPSTVLGTNSATCRYRSFWFWTSPSLTCAWGSTCSRYPQWTERVLANTTSTALSGNNWGDATFPVSFRYLLLNFRCSRWASYRWRDGESSLIKLSEKVVSKTSLKNEI